jgi:thioredoxin 1
VPYATPLLPGCIFLYNENTIKYFNMNLNLTDQNFDEEIKKSEKPVLIDFFATWCGPCQVLGPMLEKIADEMKDEIDFAECNVDEFPQTSSKFNIDRIPNVVLFKNGQPIDSFIGLMPEDSVKNWLREALNK